MGSCYSHCSDWSCTVETAEDVIWKRHVDQLLLSKATLTETPVGRRPELLHSVFTWGLKVNFSGLLFTMVTIEVEGEKVWCIGGVPQSMMVLYVF